MAIFDDALYNITNVGYSYTGEPPVTEQDYLARINWSSDDITPPTFAEVQTEMEIVEVQIKRSDSQTEGISYPSISDQLDALYWDKKNGTDTWVESIDAVKAAHPKPE